MYTKSHFHLYIHVYIYISCTLYICYVYIYMRDRMTCVQAHFLLKSRGVSKEDIWSGRRGPRNDCCSCSFVIIIMSEEEPVDKKPEIEESCKPHCSLVRIFICSLQMESFQLGYRSGQSIERVSSE